MCLFSPIKVYLDEGQLGMFKRNSVSDKKNEVKVENLTFTGNLLNLLKKFL